MTFTLGGALFSISLSVDLRTVARCLHPGGYSEHAAGTQPMAEGVWCRERRASLDLVGPADASLSSQRAKDSP